MGGKRGRTVKSNVESQTLVGILRKIRKSERSNISNGYCNKMVLQGV